jgi:hypothetical protein
MTRGAALLVLLALALPAAVGEEEDRFAVWLKLLLSPEAADQARAHRVLVAQGTPALPALKKALSEARDEREKARVSAIIGEVEKREPHGLRFNAGMPKMRLTLNLVNGDDFEFALSIRNLGGKPVVLWPYLSLRVLDAKGNQLKIASRIGRYGLRQSENLLEEIPFVTLAPGKIWSAKAKLSRYMYDPPWITSWSVPAAGTYTMEFTYEFDRAAAKKGCKQDWPKLNDPDQPWNKALELKHTFSTTITVEP